MPIALSFNGMTEVLVRVIVWSFAAFDDEQDAMQKTENNRRRSLIIARCILMAEILWCKKIFLAETKLMLERRCSSQVYMHAGCP